jgi:hypothetical protein
MMRTPILRLAAAQVVGLLLLANLTYSQAWGQVKNIDDRIFEINGTTGKGKSVDEAMDNAKRAAVDQAVRVLYAQTDQEVARYMGVRSQVLAALDQLVENAQMVDKYRDGSDVIVKIGGNVLRGRLKARLLALGVVTELDKTFSGATIPRLAVLVAAESRERDLAAFAAGRINDHMTAQLLATVDDETLGMLAESDRRLLGSTSAGPNAAVAQADVVLILSVDVQNTANIGPNSLYRAVVTVEARIPGMLDPISIETYRSRELTFKTSEDREKARRAAIEEAVGGAMRPVMQTVLRSVKDEKTLGRVYSLRLSGDAARIPAVSSSLRLHCSESTLIETPDGAVVTVRYGGQLDDLIGEIASDPALRLRVSSESVRHAEIILDP